MEALYWIVILVSAIFLLTNFQLVWTWLILSCSFLRKPYFSIANKEEIPVAFLELVEDAVAQLEGFGFRYVGALSVKQEHKVNAPVSIALQFIHSEKGTIASLLETSYLGATSPYQIIFSQFYESGDTVITTDCFAHDFLYLTTQQVAYDDYSNSLSHQWELHQKTIANKQDVPKQFRYASDAEVVASIQQEYNSGITEQFEQMVARRMVFRWGNVYQYNPINAAYKAKELVGGFKKVLEAHRSVVDTPTSRKKHRQTIKYFLMKKSPPSSGNKVAVFFVTLALFLLTFGFRFDWAFIPMLVLVLLIHELGHYFAMRYFGYYDTKIFFVPFLGAAASGQKDKQVPFEEIIVFLMGPMPGILLGFGLLLLEDAGPLIAQFAYLSIFLNLINLLPILPLDGGRIMEKLVFVPFPKAQFIFYLLSTLLLLASAYYFKEWAMGIFALFPLLAVRFRYKVQASIAALKPHISKNLNDEEKVEKIANYVCSDDAKHIEAHEKTFIARQIYQYFSHGMPTVRTFSLGLTLYIACLGFGIYASQNIFDLQQDKVEAAKYWINYSKHESEQEYEWEALIEGLRYLDSVDDNEKEVQKLEKYIEQYLFKRSDTQFEQTEYAVYRFSKNDENSLNFAELIQDIKKLDPNDRTASLYTHIALIDDHRITFADKRYLLEKAYDIYQDNGSVYLLSSTLTELGNLHRKADHLEEAENYFKQGIEYDLQDMYYVSSRENFKQLIDLYYEAKRYQDAIQITREQLNAVESINTGETDAEEDRKFYIDQERLYLLKTLGWLYYLENTYSLAEQNFISEIKLAYDYKSFNKSSIELLISALLDAMIVFEHTEEYNDYRTQLLSIPTNDLKEFSKKCKCSYKTGLEKLQNDHYTRMLERLI